MSKIVPTYTKPHMNVQCMWTWKVKVLCEGCQDLETNSYVATKQIIEVEEKKQNKKHHSFKHYSFCIEKSA